MAASDDGTVRSEEVLASPAPARRPGQPVRRALLISGLLAAVAWSVMAQLSSPADRPLPTPAQPTPAQPTPAPATTAEPAADGFATGYRPTPLDGHWISPRLTARTASVIPGTHPGQRLILQARGTALVIWVGGQAPPTRSMLGYEAIALEGHRVQMSPVGASVEKAIYRWHLKGDRLRFELVSRTSGASASARLVTVPFVRWG